MDPSLCMVGLTEMEIPALPWFYCKPLLTRDWSLIWSPLREDCRYKVLVSSLFWPPGEAPPPSLSILLLRWAACFCCLMYRSKLMFVFFASLKRLLAALIYFSSSASSFADWWIRVVIKLTSRSIALALEIILAEASYYRSDRLR